ncbi:hypothetical protein TEA_008118 [Camellia sinensis var. sinensis]|uniref:Uncharacterized protein n=1 Tax=Camellia sinensis var. sinensis TaxID=542762 RepID=A0A4S4E643_CAMSN|nr:hypothetical protein TEA_008118 [Camellia sinensis var. sinensis]
MASFTTHKDVDVNGRHFELIPFGAASNALVDMSESAGLTNMKATPLEKLKSGGFSGFGQSRACINDRFDASLCNTLQDRCHWEMGLGLIGDLDLVQLRVFVYRTVSLMYRIQADTYWESDAMSVNFILTGIPVHIQIDTLIFRQVVWLSDVDIAKGLAPEDAGKPVFSPVLFPMFGTTTVYCYDGRQLTVSRHRIEARSVKLSSCFIKPTIVPHFKVLSAFKLRLFWGVQDHPFCLRYVMNVKTRDCTVMLKELGP